MSRRQCPCGTLGCPWEQVEPDPLTQAWWSHWFDVWMHEYVFERRQPWIGLLGGSAYEVNATFGGSITPRSVPTAELTVDVSRLGEDLVLSLDDTSIYGTSGDLDPRGYWAPDVG